MSVSMSALVSQGLKPESFNCANAGRLKSPQRGQLDEKLLKGMQYRLIGPYRGGRVLAVAGVAGDPQTYYFGAAAGGVWKSVDGGAH